MIVPNSVDTVTLLLVASHCAGSAGIDLEAWTKFCETITKLQEHNGGHFDHSLRVGIYAHGLAKHEGHRDLKFPLFAGCGHDIGKCDIDNAILNAEDFGPSEMEAVKAHTYLGFHELRDEFFFTSLVAGLHHKFQPNGYGIDWDTDVVDVSLEVKETIEEMAKFIMLCDFFDALTTRGERYEGSVEDVMMRYFATSDLGEDRVLWLLDNKF